MIDIELLTLKQLREISNLMSQYDLGPESAKSLNHPMLNKRCVCRTFSAGVHIGDVVYINGMEAKLINSFRLWQWTDGGLSLSAIANNGIKKGRLNFTGEVYLTNVIEFIPMSDKAFNTLSPFVEDREDHDKC